MLPNEMFTVCKKSLEDLTRDPRTQLTLLNGEILIKQAMIFTLIDELHDLKDQRRKLIKEIIK